MAGGLPVGESTVKAYAISMTVIVVIWIAVLYWGLRELQGILEYTP